MAVKFRDYYEALGVAHTASQESATRHEMAFSLCHCLAFSLYWRVRIIERVGQDM